MFDFSDAKTVIEEDQAGFRAGYSMMDYIFCIACINRSCKNSEKEIVLFVLMLYVPVNIFFSHVGTISCLPGFNQYKAADKVYCPETYNTVTVQVVSLELATL